MSDPFNQLTGDHSQVKRMFNKWSHLGGTEPGIETAMAITGLLKIHATLEEELVYPVLARFDRALADEAEREHHQAKEIIDLIEGMPADWSEQADNAGDRHAAMVDAMVRLEAAVQHHVAEEESVLFPKLQASCSAEELEAMGHAMYARRQQLLGDEDEGSIAGLTGISGWSATPKV